VPTEFHQKGEPVRPATILVIVAAAFLAASASGCAQAAEPVPTAAVHGALATTEPTGRDTQDNHLLNNVPLKQMIAQMIIIAQRGEDSSRKWHRRVFRLLRDGRLGGAKLTAQGLDPVQLKAFTSSLRSSGVLPPFVGVDHETLSTAAGPYGLPCARDVGKLDQLSAYRLYRRHASQLAELGVNLSFGPALELDLSSSGSKDRALPRSYGHDPQQVIAYARQFIDAYDQTAILAGAKYFPGRASSGESSFGSKIDTARSWQESELEPFRDLASDGFVQMIVVGHLIHPRFSDGNRPASLSQRALSDVLRGELGFDGLIVSDDLRHRAIASRYTVEEAATLAVAAGADLVLVSAGSRRPATIVDRVVLAVTEGVADGRIRRQAIEQAYARISKVKKQIEARRAPAKPVNIAGKLH
jgi:beta-N-acetylhexosaminidase